MTAPTTRTAPVIPGAVPAAVIAAFHARTARCGRHLLWTATADKGTTPTLHVGHLRYPARRVAWVLHRGTAPVGHVKVSCGAPLCVDGPHLTDEVTRQADRVLYAAVVHGIALTGTCRDGHDRARWAFVDAKGRVDCRACDNTRRRTARAQEGATEA